MTGAGTARGIVTTMRSIRARVTVTRTAPASAAGVVSAKMQMRRCIWCMSAPLHQCLRDTGSLLLSLYANES